MSTPSLKEQIAAAEAYEELHVRALFGAWAEPVLDAAEVASSQRVLDVACGTGVLARAALARVGPDGSVAGVDPDPGMIALAGRLEPGVEWREGRAEALPFPDGSFDAVVSQFGLMFFTDPVRAVREMVRVLEPGGVMAVAVWDSLENSPAYALEVALLERVAGPAAADALRAPFVLGDAGDLAALFQEAGVSSPRVTTRRGTADFPSVRAMVEADLRGWLPVMGVTLPESQIDRILSEADTELAPWVQPDGRAAFDLSAHIVVAGRDP